MAMADSNPQLLRWWALLTAVALSAVVLTMGYWSIRHKQPFQWDENEYLNANHRDLIAKKAGGWPAYAKSLVYTYPYRPPAYRLLMAPLVPTVGPRLLLLRMAGVMAFVVSAWLLYRAVRTASTPTAGAFAAVVFGSSLGMIDACRWYGTEFASYLAVTLAMGMTFRIVGEPQRHHRDWILLGVAVAIGLLAKMSFPWIVGPMFAVAVIAAAFGKLPWAAIGRLTAASVLAVVLVSPWYLANVAKYLEQARNSQKWDKASIGDTTWEAVRTWLNLLYVRGFGQVMAIFLGLIVLASLAMLLRHRRRPSLPLLMCLAAAIPLPAAQLLFSVNYSMRIITPAFIPLIAAVAMLAAISGLLRHRLALIVTTLAIGLQIGLVVWPWNRTYYALWDMRPLIAAADLGRHPKPHIAFLGLHADFDVEGMATPFLERGIDPKVTPLWNAGRPLKWEEIHAAARAADAVVVVPDYDGRDMAWLKFDRENAHNREFDQWLRTSGHFEGPRAFRVGDVPAYMVNVYLPKKATAPAPAP